MYPSSDVDILPIVMYPAVMLLASSFPISHSAVRALSSGFMLDGGRGRVGRSGTMAYVTAM